MIQTTLSTTWSLYFICLLFNNSLEKVNYTFDIKWQYSPICTCNHPRPSPQDTLGTKEKWLRFSRSAIGQFKSGRQVKARDSPFLFPDGVANTTDVTIARRLSGIARRKVNQFQSRRCFRRLNSYSWCSGARASLGWLSHYYPAYGEGRRVPQGSLCREESSKDETVASVRAASPTPRILSSRTLTTHPAALPPFRYGLRCSNFVLRRNSPKRYLHIWCRLVHSANASR